MVVFSPLILNLMATCHLQTSKHQNRFRRLSLKMRGSDRLSGDCLTKAVLSCQGPPDTSQSRLFPLVLHHAGGLVQSPAVSRTSTYKQKTLEGRSVLIRFKKICLQYFPKPTKQPTRVSHYGYQSAMNALNHNF